MSISSVYAAKCNYHVIIAHLPIVHWNQVSSACREPCKLEQRKFLQKNLHRFPKGYQDITNKTNTLTQCFELLRKGQRYASYIFNTKTCTQLWLHTGLLNWLLLFWKIIIPHTAPQIKILWFG